MKAESVIVARPDAFAVRVPGRAHMWVVPLVKTALAVTDVVLTAASFALAFYLRHYEPITERAANGSLTWSRQFAPYAVLLPLVIPIRLLLLRYYDLYRLRGELSFVEDLSRVFKATAIGSLLLVAAAFIYRGGVAYRTFSYSRGIFALDFVLALETMGAVRMFLRSVQIVARCRGVEFRIALTLLTCLPSKTEIDQVGSLPMVTLFRSPLSSAARIGKRSFDLFLALLSLIVLSPLWLVIAVLIKLDSRGPILYRQERVGMDGRVFLFFKLRTMRADTDDAAHREFQRKYITGQPESNLGDEDRPAYKLRADERVTRVGRLLRKTSLDELPQLFNVLCGDMSIVGPRPPIPYEVE